MKKVAVVANHKTINYGTMLQAYATQRALEALDFQTETLDLSGVERDIKNKKLAYFNTQMTKRALLESKLPFVKKQIRRKLDPKFRRQLAQRDACFAAFRTTHFPISAACADRDALSDRAREYDAVLVGSDQIWLPSNIAADIFTLSFVPDDVRKVAYASSFGVSSLPESQHETAKAFLNRIDRVSVREVSGQALVKDVAARAVPVVCDPTLLFTGAQWDTMIPRKRVIDEPYIFCYFLGNNPEQRVFAREIKKSTGLQIVSLLHMDEYISSDNHFADIAPYDVGPDAFLNLIRHANYVFTDSFHGTALSVLYEKNVFTFNRFKQNAAVSTNTRIDSLYEVTGLGDRHISASVDPLKCLNMETDYKDAFAKIEVLRHDSWNYLKKALEVSPVDSL